VNRYKRIRAKSMEATRQFAELARHAGYDARVIDFGKVHYEPGAPKNAPRWIWRCGCDECRALPMPEGCHGPFRTRDEAERDAEQALSLFNSDTAGTA